jgi:hypothetical protein
MPPSWICCQLGAREHYAIPRVLQQNNRLTALLTDAWVRPQSPISYLPDARLKERFHSDLDRSDVYHSVNQLIVFEVKHKFLGTSGWELILARNAWFQKQVLQKLNKISSKIDHSESHPIVFAYSYAALNILQYAKQKGWKLNSYDDFSKPYWDTQISTWVRLTQDGQKIIE